LQTLFTPRRHAIGREELERLRKDWTTFATAMANLLKT